MEVRVPQKGVAPDGTDIQSPTTELLRSLYLLPKDTPSGKDGFAVAFTGSEFSVAVIEAGATAASKWWSAGLAGTAATVGISIRGFWTALNDRPDAQRALLVGGAIVIAAALLGIAYLLGSDVRGRAAAMVATLEARSSVAAEMIRATQQSYKPEPKAEPQPVITALPNPLDAQSLDGPDSRNWLAVAMRTVDDDVEFLLIKDAQQKWLKGSHVKFTGQ